MQMKTWSNGAAGALGLGSNLKQEKKLKPDLIG